MDNAMYMSYTRVSLSPCTFVDGTHGIPAPTDGDNEVEAHDSVSLCYSEASAHDVGTVEDTVTESVEVNGVPSLRTIDRQLYPCMQIAHHRSGNASRRRRRARRALEGALERKIFELNSRIRRARERSAVLQEELAEWKDKAGALSGNTQMREM
ncbi:hypothetical protein CYLTODRAFT_492831 [Cylindrobasidium torrendii FP15055 ss-10]|uniref:Uncharacterized protein n=1 Tax=Cylindrobasidium torrendii FP15055 ss-10 TaxID=1314674 RepID=A0A0D7B5L0_9AGAR|nr:hypothetical protein CYLTODRAFT_492831 [Cylindrobasidium torrendii FP15055 ss-10]